MKKNEDLSFDKNRIDADIRNKFEEKKDFSAIRAYKKPVLTESAASRRMRNSIIAWSAVAASFLLIASFMLPMFKDIVSSLGPGKTDPTVSDNLFETENNRSHDDMTMKYNKDITESDINVEISGLSSDERKKINTLACYELYEPNYRKDHDGLPLNDTSYGAYEVNVIFAKDTGDFTGTAGIRIYQWDTAAEPSEYSGEDPEPVAFKYYDLNTRDSICLFDLTQMDVPEFKDGAVRIYVVDIKYYSVTVNYIWYEVNGGDVPDTSGAELPVPELADVRISTLTDNGREKVKFNECIGGIYTKEQLREANIYSDFHHFSYAVEMEIEMEKPQTCTVGVETTVYDLRSDGSYELAIALKDRITLTDGKGTYYASTSNEKVPRSRRIYCIVLTYGEKAVSYIWNEKNLFMGYDYDKENVETAAPEKDPVWEQDSFYVKVFSRGEEGIYNPDIDKYDEKKNISILKTAHAAASQDNKPSYSMDIMIYKAPGCEAKEAEVVLEVYALKENEKDVWSFGLHQRMTSSVVIDTERRGGFGIKPDAYLSLEIKAYMLYVTVDGQTKTYTWYEKCPLRSSDGSETERLDNMITSSDTDITDRVNHLEDPKNLDKEAVLMEMTATHDPLKPSVCISAYDGFYVGKLKYTAAILELYDMDRDSPNFMNITAVYYWSGYNAQGDTVAVFDDLPELSSDSCRGYILTFKAETLISRYVWYEAGEDYDLSKFDGLVTAEETVKPQ